jgi:hypothetical protein
VKRVVALSLVLAAVTAPTAAAKGVTFTLESGDRTPVVGERVTLTLRGLMDEGVEGPCLRTRLVVVAPGVSVKRALRSLEGGRESRRIGRWGAFRLASLRSVAELTWTGRLRPDRAGRWTLVVPNHCALGYVLPLGAARFPLDVARRPTARPAPP